ncbi:malto-oligosyltrehalose synthase [Cellvibrio fibrivorans]|uniref:(1->4)-alpha-D-glucan 1-alpha-D-glucosylmutase n=1 Tax=Cellvibrio fibrivorans TaxID=126350 RepID=A0ABU1UWB6_9GAMM|nr:malto-oligosyltrehalose synthase [Cellvibrio fibrivorans]MDR7089455.1 (1->4)-alpha-D-glucan 1-alpha-D-glucosylmutase [Cellvibrio fibrivorans]
MPDVRATVRLQFHRDFTFDDAIPLVAYFSELGISHIYSSPILKARAGSQHGYDVVDPTQVNPELGGEEALERLVAELRRYDMGLIVDIVSNHMAVGKDDNPWWLDALKWGAKSRYAKFFDIQWNSPDPALKGQLLVPFLRTNYGDVLAAGEITVHFNEDTGEFYARHFDHYFPLSPASYSHILYNSPDPVLQAFAQPFAALETSADGWQAAPTLHQQLRETARQPEQRASIAAVLALYRITPNNAETSDQPEPAITDSDGTQSTDNLDRLHHLLELQYYRLASWRTAADDINWRRFFDVNELGGLRVERQQVFEAIHARIFELIERGIIDGLRIDHVDGLANPRAYCRKLRRRLDRLVLERPTELKKGHLPLYAEKILADGEQLARDWMLDGTTGYEFMNQVSLLQHDPKGAFQLYDLWSRVSGRAGTFEEEVKEARRLVLSSNLAGDVETVAQGLLSIARLDIRTRDLTLSALRRALIELVVHFPVYRTYVTVCGRTASDQIEFFNRALAGAKTTLAEADWPLLEHLDRWLGGEPLHELPPGATRDLRRKVLARFQQLTSPAAAKAVEDTACYRSAVLLSRNDVGFDPQHFSAPPAQFHARNGERARSFPHNLLTTATHDHKRGEDTRARLAVISERSVWFSEKVANWQTAARSLRTELPDGIAPSPGDELILYQTLLGCWPPQLEADDEAAMEAFLTRVLRWQEKALREAKLRSHWSAPNAEYEAACTRFVTDLLTSVDRVELCEDICAAAHTIAPAGVLNSLSQTLLRMTCPGVPDLYQGTEFWDFSLVDPDNRQPVDFFCRRTALAQVERTAPADLVQHWPDGRLKQWLISRTLSTRKQYPALFSAGDYQALTVEGEQADHVLAFTREHKDNCLLVVIPRLTTSLLDDTGLPLIPAAAWGDTQVLLPSQLSGRIFTHSLLSNARCQAPSGRLPVAQLLDGFPVHLSIARSTTSLQPNQSTFKTPTPGELHDECS